MTAVDALRSCKYLYLHHLGEPSEGELLVVVHEAVVGGPPAEEVVSAETLPEVRSLLSESLAIEHRPGCRVFSLRWKSYIGYSVLNESYALPEPKDSVAVGRLFVEYSKSVYLEYLSHSTFASSDYPGPFRHWGVHCLNHIVDVASCEEPEIEVSTAA